MEQRTSVMLAAIIFAIVVAGSIAYLIYYNPDNKQVTFVSPTSTPTSATVKPTPPLIVIATPTPKPNFRPVVITKPSPAVASAVSTSAKTGTTEWLMALLVMAPIAGTISIFKLSQQKNLS